MHPGPAGRRAESGYDDGFVFTIKDVGSELGQPFKLSDADNKRVLRKIDWLLMPMMSVAVLLQFLDKTSLNYANLL